MSEAARQWISPEEYLALEESAEGKSEYFNGEIFAMSGGTSQHNVIAGQVLAALVVQLFGRPCLVHTSDQRVRIADTGLYTYPDVTVVCGPPEFENACQTTLLNPTVIIEILSESTEAYDRGDKFAHYQTLPSVREYVLIASDRHRIERFSRAVGSSDWMLSVCTSADGSLALESIGCILEMSRVYDKIEFQERPRSHRPLRD